MLHNHIVAIAAGSVGLRGFSRYHSAVKGCNDLGPSGSRNIECHVIAGIIEAALKVVVFRHGPSKIPHTALNYLRPHPVIALRICHTGNRKCRNHNHQREQNRYLSQQGGYFILLKHNILLLSITVLLTVVCNAIIAKEPSEFFYF